MATISEALAIAVEHHQAGCLEAAAQIYQQILSIDPDQIDALHLLGVVKYQNGQHDAAVQHIGRAIDLNATEPSFHSNLGNAFLAQGKLDKAVDCFRQALVLNPRSADEHNDLGNAFHAQRNLEDAVKCFRRALELKPDYAFTHNNLGNVFQTQGKLDEAGESYRRALELKPDYALAHSNLGNVLQDQGKMDAAVASYIRALELKPDFAQAHYNLGNVFLAQKKLDKAVKCFRRALELKADFAEAYSNLGTALADQGLLDEALNCFRQALKLKPDYAAAHRNLGNAFRQFHRFDDVMAGYNRALELKPDFAEAHFDRSMLRLLLGDFQHGWPEYEWRWKTKEFVGRFSQPKWDGSPLEHRTILLHTEQGFGDTLQFIRYVALLKKQNATATVIVECERQLAKLLARCSGVDRIVVEGGELPPFDVQSPLLSLPGILQTTLATIPVKVPYLFADPELVRHWRGPLSSLSGLRVGINWHGRAGPGEHLKRNIPLECFAALARLSGISLVSLQIVQVDERSSSTDLHFPIFDPGPDFDTVHGSFMDTSALMMNLDLVITSDTSVPHLAGALGIPVWVALPFLPDWRWLLNHTDSPWYPTMRLFRQKSPGDWKCVFAEITESLLEMLAKGVFDKAAKPRP